LFTSGAPDRTSPQPSITGANDTDPSHTVGLGTEHVDDGMDDLDLRSTREVVRAMHTYDLAAVAAVGTALDTIAVVAERVAGAFVQGGRLIYVGAGTSGRLASLDASEIAPTFGTRPDQIVVIQADSEDDEAAGRTAIDRAAVGPNDVVIGIAASGRTPFVVAAIEQANAAAATTVGVSCNTDAPLTAVATLAITVTTGAELVAGSTRLKAGTAQKLVLNMITTAAMVTLGRTYGNRMVAMATANGKLDVRGARMVADIGQCSDERAAELLALCDGEIRTAIVVHRLGLQPADARALLDRSDGSLRRALGS